MIRKTIAIAIDALASAILITVAAIVLTGGTTVQMGRIKIGLHSPDNLLWLLLLLLAARYAVRDWSPLLGRSSWPVSHTLTGAWRFVANADAWLGSVRASSAHKYLALLVILAVSVRILNAWLSAGFYSGDDVEIQEMTISALRGAAWPIWDLRSPIYPFLFGCGPSLVEIAVTA